MTILITGSKGKTSSRLALQLRGRQPILIAGRSGDGLEDIPGVKFDWSDPSTFDSIFAHPHVQSSPITAVYLVPPIGTMDVFLPMKPFIDLMQSKGVKRFVLLSASGIDADSPYFTGLVHKYLRDSGAEWTVLRPSWFMENFNEMGHHKTIRDESKIYTATGSGKVPFVACHDIAASAAAALTRAESYNRDFIIGGPESLSYDEVAEIFSEVLGRNVQHVQQSEEERKDLHVKQGVPEAFASLLAQLDTAISHGKEDHRNKNVEEITGHEPVALRAYVEKHKQDWIKE